MTSAPLPWTGAATPSRRWRWPTIRSGLLFASLAGNVFLLAHAAAPMFRPNHQPGYGGMVERFARNLPPDDAMRFRAVLDHDRPAFEATRRDMDAARDRLSRAIGQTPFDPALIRDRMTDWQAHLQTMSSHFGDTLLLALPLMSPEGRARLADSADHPPGPPPPPSGSPSASASASSSGPARDPNTP